MSQGCDREAQRQRSLKQGMLLAEVRRRDGDACRVCACVVHTKDRKSAYALNYRILHPGTTLTVAGVVVVCRQHLTDGNLLPVPAVPYYTDETAYWLDEAPTAAAPVVETEAADVDGLRIPNLRDSLHQTRRAVFDRHGDVDSCSSHLGGHDLDSESLGSHEVLQRGHAFVQIHGLVLQAGAAIDLALKILDDIQNSSPSVGAPGGAGCDDPQPTEGESDQGESAP